MLFASPLFGFALLLRRRSGPAVPFKAIGHQIEREIRKAFCFVNGAAAVAADDHNLLVVGMRTGNDLAVSEISVETVRAAVMPIHHGVSDARANMAVVLKLVSLIVEQHGNGVQTHLYALRIGEPERAINLRLCVFVAKVFEDAAHDAGNDQRPAQPRHRSCSIREECAAPLHWAGGALDGAAHTTGVWIDMKAGVFMRAGFGTDRSGQGHARPPAASAERMTRPASAATLRGVEASSEGKPEMADVPVELDVAVGFEIGPKFDLPGVIIILRHQKFAAALASELPTEAKVLLAREQAEEFHAMLGRALAEIANARGAKVKGH